MLLVYNILRNIIEARVICLHFSACDENQVRCDNGVCIRSQEWCDGRSQCPDDSDEKENCSELETNKSFSAMKSEVLETNAFATKFWRIRVLSQSLSSASEERQFRGWV